MKKSEYAIKVYGVNERLKLQEVLAGMGIIFPSEYTIKKNFMDDLYIIDVDGKTVRRIDDYDEKKAFIHTGARVIWTDDFKREVESCSKPERIWKRLYREDGTLAYEGFTENGRPHGAGKAFYPNGGTYQEGIFGEKGLLSGVEYYDNGQVRFDGILKYHNGYGPNYPVYGRCYYRDGRLMFDGQLKVRFVGNLAYPHVEIPEDYGTVAPGDRPRY